MRQRLESGTAAERLDTLRKAGDPPHAILRPALEDILARDLNPVARAMAANALGNLKDPQSIERLRYALRRDTDPSVRRKALSSLVAIKQDASKDDLKYILNNDPKPLLRITALDFAVETLTGSERIQILQAGISDRAEVVRLVAYLHLRDVTGIDIPPDADMRWLEELKEKNKCSQ